MKYLKKDRWRISFSQRIAIFSLLVLILAVELILTFQQSVEKVTLASVDKSYYLSLEKELETLLADDKTSQFKKKSFTSKFNKDSISPFNPNDLPKQGWERLGFTAKQAEVIMKYKQMLGGKFESKDQIKKCFVVSDEVYALLESKILLPEKSKNDYKLEKQQLSKKVNYRKFNPNQFTEKDWMNIGFSSKQAEVILKYKKMVGGEFTSKEQIKKCFVISDEKYKEMHSYIDLPDKSEAQFPKKDFESKEINETKENPTPVKPTLPKVEITEKFNPNELDLEGWMRLGFTEKQAQTILNFKRSMGGKFKDGKTLSRSYVISEEKFKEMEPFLVFD